MLGGMAGDVTLKVYSLVLIVRTNPINRIGQSRK